MIIIKPVGGLANRLRALDSAIALTTKYEMKLYVIWELNQSLNCKFSDLFIVPKELDRIIEIKRGFVTKILDHLLPIYFSHFNNYHLDPEETENLKRKRDGFETLSSYNSVYIESWSRFYRVPSLPSFSRFLPKASIQNIINSYRETNMIGVHVRRKDHKRSIAFSPIEKFIECMNNEIDKDNNVKFFLATDSTSVETTLRTIFPDKIVTHCKKSLDRNNPFAIKDALIDLYCLANCRKLIGSYWSSFSGVASEINGIERFTIKEEHLGMVQKKPIKGNKTLEI